MISELLSESFRTTALSAAMKGAGLAVRFLPIPQPVLLVGPGASGRLGQTIAGFGHGKLLIVTDSIISRLGLLDDLTNALTAGGAEYVVFDAITPDAPIPLIEEGIDFYWEHGCDAIVAFGGGSSMDASKAIAAAVSNPGKTLRELAGYFKGLQTPVKIYAVPTTAGTGSEVTVAAVISDPETQTKLVIVDTRLVPKMAALDPCLMTGLPPHITAATGIDALTHAIEAFVGKWANPYTDDMALSAVGLIFDNLRVAYSDGKNLEAREKMALAATYAGLAFTRANVGYVHAIAHQFGGKYHTPHGLANAIMLPRVLKFSLPAITDRLALLAVRAKLGQKNEPEDVLAQKFIDAVEQLNLDLGIPAFLAVLKESDIPQLAEAACHEARTGYPVPRYMTQAVCEDIIRQVLPPAASAKKPARRTKKAA
ncbi:iron-containing alcohol dehydrogenase [Sulfuritalea hydrogenivorans]|uniref:Iron-containing alcohol dehydrogenase n=1 Tax=Sulfuritalea hydrogenivorans sk43H TaxID=1223802 RepID=W0SIM5_9PROT|nr:iron-containing alcohol dehydrogenase [Sulfuritalea hydrogenivorans]BAO30391.1 iron-containing alcohol dehydrogenase [Sulfuritalea hydrogenivorans sk43H]